MSHWSNALRRIDACQDAVQWAATQTSRKRAWKACERGDWMMWIAARSGMDRKLVVAAACACARLSLKHAKSGDERPRIAIETAEAWCRGEATIKQVRTAAAAAADAAAYDAIRKSTLKESADICRRMLPMPNLPIKRKQVAA